MDFDVVAHGIVAGSLYALVAVSFNILYRPTNVFNFAQGELVMLGAMIFASITSLAGMPWFAALTATLVAVGLIGLVEERVAVAPILARSQTGTGWVITTLAVSLIISNLAGLVAVTPAAGFSGVMGAIVLGLVVGVVCLFFCTVVKNALGYDDSLDVFGVHCVGGIVGALGTGILVNPALGGAGIIDYTAIPPKVADYDFAAQMISQIEAVCTTLVWSGIGSAILYKVVDVIVGLRVNVETEREGLDITEHTERAYNM